MADTGNGDDGLNRPAEIASQKIDFRELTDEELMLLVQEGRSRAYDIIVNRYKNRLFTYLFRLLGDRDEAEEFAQEAFVKAYLHADKYRTVARFSTWLYTIATNLVRNRIRTIKRRPTTISLWSGTDGSEDDGKWVDVPDDSRRPDEELERRDLREIIQGAVERIPEKYRSAFVLREMNEMSYEEIAAVTGLKLGTVRSRINRGRVHFKKMVAPYAAVDGCSPKGNKR